MNTIAVVYHSKFGHTHKIACFIRDYYLRKGITVHLYPIKKAKRMGILDAKIGTVIIGGPIFLSHFNRNLVSWVKEHRLELQEKRTAFFSVSLNAADQRPEARLADDKILMSFFKKTDWIPNFVASISGALEYTKYNWLVRQLLRRISSAAHGPTDIHKDHDLTDWALLANFLNALAKDDHNGSFATENRLPFLESRYEANLRYDTHDIFLDQI